MQQYEIIEVLNEELSKEENIFNTEDKMPPINYLNVTCTFMTFKKGENHVTVRVSSPATDSANILHEVIVELTNVETGERYSEELSKYSGCVINKVERGRYRVQMKPPKKS